MAINGVSDNDAREYGAIAATIWIVDAGASCPTVHEGLVDKGMEESPVEGPSENKHGQWPSYT